MSLPKSIRIYFSPTMLLMLVLGFASGLPFALTAGTLSSWMTEAKIDIKTIGVFALVTIPYALKFLWSPLLDRFALPFLGLRRGWMLFSQVGLMGSIALLASLDPQSQIVAVAFCAFVVAFFSATQDIALDAWRTETLKSDELGAGAGVWVMGWRLGALVSGGLALVIAEFMSWQMVYLIMGATLGLAIIATLFAKEPDHGTHTATAPKKSSVAFPVRYHAYTMLILGLLLGVGILPPLLPKIPAMEQWLNTLLWGGGFVLFVWVAKLMVPGLAPMFERYGKTLPVILLFLLTYKLGDAAASQMTSPYVLKTLQYAKSDLGWSVKVVGMIATIIGGLVGGALMAKWSLQRALIVFGIAQMIVIPLFPVLQWTMDLRMMPQLVDGIQVIKPVNQAVWALAIVICIEYFGNALGTTAYTAFMMALCDRKLSATQYALVSSLMAISRMAAGASTGYVAEWAGWTNFYLICTAAAIPGLFLMLWYKSWGPKPQQS